MDAVRRILVGVLMSPFLRPVSAQEAGVEALTGNIEVARLLDLAASRAGVTVQYDASELKGSTTIRQGSPLSDAELWDVSNQSLHLRGLTTVKTAGRDSFAVVKLADASALVTPVELAELDHRSGFAAVVYDSVHTPASNLAEQLGKLGAKPGTVSVLNERQLVLSDIRPRLLQILALTSRLDRPVTEMPVVEISLRASKPVEIVATVTQIMAKRQLAGAQPLKGEVLQSPRGDSVLVVAPESQGQAWRDLIESLDRGEIPTTAAYPTGRFDPEQVVSLLGAAVPGAGTGGWRVIPDALTGSVFVTATTVQHEAVKKIIDQLESTPPAPKSPVRSWKIQNRNVTEIQDLLQRLVVAGVVTEEPIAGSAPAAPAAAGPEVIAMPPPPRPDSSAQPMNVSPAPSTISGGLGDTVPVTLTIDEGTNTLIAIGPPSVLQQIDQLLKTADVRQPQVMLEVLIVTLSDTKALELGVELEQLITSGDVRTRLASLFGLGTRDGVGNRIGGDGSGFTGVVLNPGDYSVLVRALETINRGRALSMPKLLVANNQQATLNSTLSQPYISVNATNQLASQSYGGSSEAGTQVTIKPQIAEGDSLILTYNISLSAFVGAAADESVPPPKQQNQINSMATIPDGYTVVVGGIEVESDSRGINQVPGIGNIPVLGELFKRRSNNASRSRFYVFIRAGILRDRGFEDLRYISDQQLARSPGVDDGFPVVEPRIIR
jgi:general secretion pathway protein D